MEVQTTPPLPHSTSRQQPMASKYVEAQNNRPRTEAARPVPENTSVIASTVFAAAANNVGNVTSQPQPQQQQQPPGENIGYFGPEPQVQQRPQSQPALQSLSQPMSQTPQMANSGIPAVSQAYPPPPPPPSYSSNTVPPSDAPTMHTGHNYFGQATYTTADRNFVSAAPAPVQPTDPYAGPQSVMPMPQHLHQQQQPHAYNPFAPFEHPQMQQFGDPHQVENRAASHHPSSSSSSSAGEEPDTRPDNTYANRFKAIMKAVTISEVGPMILLAGGMLAHHYRNRGAEKLIPYQMPKWIRYMKNMLFAYNGLKFARNNGLIKGPPKIAPTWPQETGKRGLGPSGGAADAMPPPIGHRSLTDYDPYTDNDYNRPRDLHEHEPSDNDVVMQMVNAIVGELFQNGDMAQNSNGHLLDKFDHSWAVPQQLAEDCHRQAYYSDKNLAAMEPHFLGGAAAIQALQTERQVLQQNAQSQLDLKHEYQVMGMALSECDTLLERKAQSGMLGPDDNLGHVGKVALATVIKIKAEEDAASTSHNGRCAQAAHGYEQAAYSHAQPYDYAPYTHAPYEHRAYPSVQAGYPREPPPLDNYARHHSYYY
ncbi:hypothetical protein IWW55_002182 [Coemansia sp. RSA 2706]|nr:hypothetical protein LPJ63_004235 [Coemansia sp. RSA 2711]KAJ2303588.1 hypothetical protein IWW54_005679 [Coemansia sp. RSA 2705]KAJ2304941.1 hypothetical protein IWW55_002182 [Coemansia sp. RSA 2706]KAJ2316722.1 hypothetical protein IWW52_003497 [Coemansia sp. RSA 2704]KAJ2383653.1 hypothetical protein H4S02_005200 [Coemansia sp. RSA 2611]